MSVNSVVRKALESWAAGDVEEAWRQAVIATDATALRALRHKYPNKKKNNRQRFTEFIQTNMNVVTRCSTGFLTATTALKMRIKHPDLKPTIDDVHTIEEIIYQLRCDLVHEAEMPSGIQLTEKLIFGGGGNCLPSQLVLGIIFAVIVSPVNRNGYLPPCFTLTINGKTVMLNDLWGKKDECMKWFAEANKAGREQRQEQ